MANKKLKLSLEELMDLYPVQVNIKGSQASFQPQFAWTFEPKPMDPKLAICDTQDNSQVYNRIKSMLDQ